MHKDEKSRQKKLSSVHHKENEFSKQKFKYSHAIVDYLGSPTGKAYVGLAKTPLMENPSGIGFQGVKLQSENRELIQCNECGKWYKFLTPGHLRRHGLTSQEYKEKYGLYATTSLASDCYSMKQAKILDERIARGEFTHKLSREERMKRFQEGREKAIKEGKYHFTQMERKNEKGTCPEQLKSALANYIHRFKRLPCKGGRGPKFQHIWILIEKFGEPNKIWEHYGLPTRKLRGRIVEYLFPDGTFFMIKNGLGYEELYTLMKEKCQILKDYPA